VESELLSKLRTKEDLDILRGELDLLENALYQSSNIYNDIIKNDIRSWVSEIVLKEGKEDLSGYIKKIKVDLLKAPVLSASINFEPSSSFIEKLSLWLKKNIDEKIVVDLLLNTASLGGIQLSYKGKYLDLSLRKKISAELSNMRLRNA
jgi:hypothetical protein